MIPGIAAGFLLAHSGRWINADEAGLNGLKEACK